MTIIETSPRSGPTVRRGHSIQTCGTPWEFIRAVEKRFGPILVDLAASAENAKAKHFFTEADDSLRQPLLDWRRAR